MYNSIYPGYRNYYPGLNNRQITKRSDDEKQSRQSNSAQNQDIQEKNVSTSNQSFDNSVSSQLASNISGVQNNIVFPNGEKSAIDYTKRQINIIQVLTDFRNTANAIGAPDDIKEEVQSYLQLVESQAKKEVPNRQIIQSNLKSASKILDEYITNTLNKQSNVVENWVDALFMQHIDFKLPESEVDVQDDGDIVVETYSSGEEDEYIIEEEPSQPITEDFYVPLDTQLKSMFIQAKKYAEIDNKDKALYAFQTVADYAEETGDFQTAAIAYYEQGLLYDDFNRIEDALYSFDRASKQSNDNNVKAKAHLSMGKIYDDYVNFEPAVEHYCAAVSFAGESDNLNLQIKALSDLSKMHADRYDKENTFLFMDIVNTVAEETKNDKVIGITFASNALCCEKLNENARALEYYGKSAQMYDNAQYYEGLAKDYIKASDIMLKFGNKAKAKKLLSKAFITVQKTDNSKLKRDISDRITSL